MAFGTITYITGVEGVSRKFALRHEIAGKTIPAFIGGMVRKRNLAGIGIVAKNFMFVRKNYFSSSPSEEQMNVRALFSRAAKAAAVILKDVQQLVQSQALYREGQTDYSKTIAGISVFGNTYIGWIRKVTFARVANDPTITDQALKTFPTTWDA